MATEPDIVFEGFGERTVDAYLRGSFDRAVNDPTQSYDGLVSDLLSLAALTLMALVIKDQDVADELAQVPDEMITDMTKAFHAARTKPEFTRFTPRVQSAHIRLQALLDDECTRRGLALPAS